MSFKCNKCDKTFKSEKNYEKHKIKQVPCDYICKFCGCKCGYKQAFYDHVNFECLKNREKVINNNVNQNNVDAKNINNQQNTNNNNNVNQNILLMQPFEIDREYMEPKKILTPVRDIVIHFLKLDKVDEAYEVLFQQIHGNEKYPQYHNIYLPDINRDEVAVFKGKNFVLDSWDKRIPGLFLFLKHEMGRLVWVYSDINNLTLDEKDKLDWNIKKHWRQTNEYNDPNMKRILFNNRSVVFDTFSKYTVKPNAQVIMSEYKHAELPVPVEIYKDHTVKLIK